ncbi:MAG: hypothetical protein RIR83_574 [Pseudomonadota bacterium]
MRTANWHLTKIQNIFLTLLLPLTLIGCQSMPPNASLDPDNTSYKRMITQGKADKILVNNVYDCPRHNPKMNIRQSAVGQITATDGTVITVPAETALQKGLGPKSFDLYNECNQVTPKNSSEVVTDKVPVIEIDHDGEVITGFIVADNYYEMWINNQLVSVDNTPYTPFNSAIVKFKVKRPYTISFLIVDWDEHLGLGMEEFPKPVTPTTTQWYPGDGGLIAKFCMIQKKSSKKAISTTHQILAAVPTPFHVSQLVNSSAMRFITPFQKTGNLAGLMIPIGQEPGNLRIKKSA